MDNLEQALLESENSLMLLSDEELITPINDMLIINPETRLIEVPNTELLLGVFGENLVEKKYFKCPRIVLNNIDLYECFIFINYVSASGRIGSIQSENVELDETEQYILFDWDLTNNVFDKNKDGTIYFSVSAKQYLEDSEPVFATRKAQGKMYETINGTEHVTQEHADIILQILAGMKTKVDLPKDEDGNLLVPEEGQTLLFKEDGTTYYGTPSSGGGTSFSGSAKDVTYDDTETKLGAENVQDAIGKLSEDITIEVEYDFLLLHESDGVNSSYFDVGVDVKVGDVLKCVTPRVDGKNLDDRIDIYTSVDGVDKYQSLEFPIIKDVFGETPITEVELIVEITEEVTSIRVHKNTTVYKREEITIGKKVSSIETELIKVQKEIDDLKGGEIPDYWYGAFTDSAGKTYTNYLSEKIETIKALQRQYGKDCFSFLLITDVHYPSNLGKRSPTLADRIMDECNIKHALNAGDNNTRGCYLTLEEILSENKQVAKMFAPIMDRLLIIEGNHDGSYYWSGGVLGSGTAYVKQLTEQGMFEEYYRANGLNAEAHFDKNSNAFYVDDLSNKVRYIGLNSMNVPNSKDDVNADGTAKYTKFHNYQFLQAQYDFLCKEALVNGLTDDWKVVVFGHSGIYNAGDYAVMVDVLSAYKNKANCVAEYAGTASGSVPNYDNLLDETGDGFLWGYLSTDSKTEVPSAEQRKMFTNYIPIKTHKSTPDILRVLDKNKKLYAVKCYDSNKQAVSALQNWITVDKSDFVYDEDGVMTWKAAYVNDYVATTTVNSLAYVRLYFASETDIDLNDIAITVNQPIEETTSEHGYDYVSVNHDFTDAKGKFIAYFHGHDHKDADYTRDSIKDISTRCDGVEEHTEALQNERVKGTITEQSFDVFTVTPNKIYATKIGAGSDRVISY